MHTSDSRATRTASLSSLFVTWRTTTRPATLERIPSRGHTAYGGVPLYQSTRTRSASGPMTATDLISSLSRGSSRPSFFRRTIDFWVARRTADRCASDCHGFSSESPIVEYGTIGGGHREARGILTP